MIFNVDISTNKFMRANFEKIFFAFFLIMLSALFAFSQDTEPPPNPPEEPITIFTEEIHLNVTVQNAYGGSVPRLKPDDLLVVEEGEVQTITSIKQIPANVLLLLDTSNEMNFVKSKAMTSLTAKILITNLSPTDTIAVLQYNSKIETVSDWTTDKTQIYTDLDRKLLSGKRARFSEAVNAAVELFKARPLENRHLVIVSDGFDSVANEVQRQTALQNLLAANITVHIISYTQLEEQAAQKSGQRVKWGDGKTKPRISPETYEVILEGLPDTSTTREQIKLLRAVNESQQIVILQLDNELIRAIRRHREAWQKSEAELQKLSQETGGMFHAPEEIETMWKFAVEIARAIGSQYVITYLPTKSFADSVSGETRKIRVSTNRYGVKIRSREKIVVAEVSQ